MDSEFQQDSVLDLLLGKAKSRLINGESTPKLLLLAILEEVEALIQSFRRMIDQCCDKNEDLNGSSLKLSELQTLIIFGKREKTSIKVKPLDKLPDQFRSRLVSEQNKKKSKKRSRQRFSQCEKCFKSWNDIRSFEIHQKEPGKCPGKPWFKILPDHTFLCIHPQCQETVGLDQSTYWNHVRDKHWLEQDLKISCQHCSDKFPLVEMMKFHVKTCHKKTKMCRFCGSVFASKNDLAKHERTHTGEKPFACDKCTFRTSTSGTLKCHIKRKHEDPNLHKTFVCHQCSKGFFSAFDLKQHVHSHSDMKRYTCPSCGKQLKNDSCYRRHMMCVHGQKFSCELCHRDFSAMMGLSIHQRDVHGIIS